MVINAGVTVGKRGSERIPATTSIRSLHSAVRPGLLLLPLLLLLLLLLLLPDASPSLSAVCGASPSLARSEAEPSCSEGSPTTRGVGRAAVWVNNTWMGL